MEQYDLFGIFFSLFFFLSILGRIRIRIKLMRIHRIRIHITGVMSSRLWEKKVSADSAESPVKF